VERPAALTLAAVAAGVVLALAPGLAGASGWSRPAEVFPPTSLEIMGTQVASSPAGAAAVAFDQVNVDAQATAGAFVALAAPGGGFGPAQAVPGAQEVLALAYVGSTLELLTASAPAGQSCCTTVQVVRRGARSGFGRPQTLVDDAGGGTSGRLVALSDGRMLAVIAAPERLWASEARGAGSFGTPRGLTAAGSAPAALAATATADGGSAIVWTQGAGGNIFGASARGGATPSRRRTLLTAPAAHAVDGVQLAAGPAGLNLAWTESWNDAAGDYHSEVMAAELAALGRPLRPRVLSAPAAVASALLLAGDTDGGEVAAWEDCTFTLQPCSVQTRVRPATPIRTRHKKRRAAPWFGPVSNPGEVDAGESPVLAMASDGGALLGWITGGRAVVAGLASGAPHFGSAGAPLSGTLADDLALGIGPGGDAVAAWTQGSDPGVCATVAR
jgi:hypothetical protein